MDALPKSMPYKGGRRFANEVVMHVIALTCIDLIGIFSSWAMTNIQVGYPRKQEFHIRYNKLTTMVENKDHLL